MYHLSIHEWQTAADRSSLLRFHVNKGYSSNFSADEAHVLPSGNPSIETVPGAANKSSDEKLYQGSNAQNSLCLTCTQGCKEAGTNPCFHEVNSGSQNQLSCSKKTQENPPR